MTNRDMAVNVWIGVISEVPAPEPFKGRSLMQKVQGRLRQPGMPEAAFEPNLACDDGSPEPPKAPVPGDLHDLLHLFQA